MFVTVMPVSPGAVRAVLVVPLSFVWCLSAPAASVSTCEPEPLPSMV